MFAKKAVGYLCPFLFFCTRVQLDPNVLSILDSEIVVILYFDSTALDERSGVKSEMNCKTYP